MRLYFAVPVSFCSNSTVPRSGLNRLCGVATSAIMDFEKARGFLAIQNGSPSCRALNLAVVFLSALDSEIFNLSWKLACILMDTPL